MNKSRKLKLIIKEASTENEPYQSESSYPSDPYQENVELKPYTIPDVIPDTIPDIELKPDIKPDIESDIESDIKPDTELKESESEESELELESDTNLPDFNVNGKYCNFDLKSQFKDLNCQDENFYSKDCNNFLLKKEFIEGKCIEEQPNHPYLYPNLNDVNFNIKIASKKEFNDTKYDGTIHKNLKEYADVLSKLDFELQPHQAFVKNFLSSQTPYNSLLLYHMLGTGKTCSAIGVCEEMRDYMKQIGVSKRIMIVASENVQNNFKLQLFDERKLKQIDGVWNIKGCVGNKLLKEINPMNMKGVPREKVIGQIKNLINTYYLFLGYGQFANYIVKIMNYSEVVQKEKEREKMKNKEKTQEKMRTQIEIYKDIKVTLNKTVIQRLRNEFNNRLIVIDEVHNIRKSDNSESKYVSKNLELLVKSAENMRFLLLSATPMYNSYTEIVWLLNLMNINDRRGKILVKDIFDKNGDFKNGGEELLIRKATGYISFVRGENPYTFPYRVYPNVFSPNHTFPHIKYPTYQMNLKKIKPKELILSLYLEKIGGCDKCGECQGCIYKYIIQKLRQRQFSITTKQGNVKEMPSFENMESFGYTLLQIPIESLIISYPIEGLKERIEKMPKEKYSEDMANLEPFDSDIDIEPTDLEPTISKPQDFENVENMEEPISVNPRKLVFDEVIHGGNDKDSLFTIDSNKLTGRQGIERMMDFVDSKSPPQKGNFKYKNKTLELYGKIFSREMVGKYSSKISCILEMILNSQTGLVSEGILLIYSQYIDAGLIPMALALEEMGFIRFGDKNKSLFQTKPTETVDVKTMKPNSNKATFMPARYAMITGDRRLSPDNESELKVLTGESNKNGDKIKVVLISRAGSEGIDFKFIRQVHILDPWYNMNLIEQIIGRAVRNISHKDLEFAKRNVEIFMHGTILGENKEEAADLYIYRVAERKAIQMGKISRILKETSVDCIINHDQTNFTQENMSKIIDEPITQILSNGIVIPDFKIGDVPYSAACDYMSTCSYLCKPNKDINEDELNEDTYNENFIRMNSEKILQKIRMLMKESFFYKKEVLINAIQIPKVYPYVQIYAALTQLIDDNSEFIVDKYGRNGKLVNIGEYYLFQPIELNDKQVSIFDRSVPIDYKHEMIDFVINQNITKPVIDKRNIKIFEQDIQKNVNGKKIVDEMKSNIQLVKEFTMLEKVPRGDQNWYKHSGIVIQKLSEEYPDIKQYLFSFIIAHMIEQLMYNDKLDLLNYLYSLDNIETNSLELLFKNYFETKVISSGQFKCIILQDLNKSKLMILNEENQWTLAEPEDQREITSDKKVKELFIFDIKDYNQYIGFIGYKSNKALVFKVKDMASTRDTGATCEESGKDKSIKKLNLILGEEKYTQNNTKMMKNANGIVREAIGQTELCVIQEFILRYFDIIRKNSKRWFLTPEMALNYKLYKIT